MSSFLAAEIKKEMDFGRICLISISFSIRISLTKLSESSESYMEKLGNSPNFFALCLRSNAPIE